MPSPIALRPSRGRRLPGATDDDALAARVRAGDDRAFELLYERYAGPLLGFCRHMVGTQQDAEDAIQHVFLAAHRHLREDPRPMQVKAWLYAAARNRCLDLLRARRDVVDLDGLAEPPSAGLACAAEVEQRQDLRDLLGDVALLPDDQRAALVLAELGDLSHDEIAEAVGVRKDKVKALVFQAREVPRGRP